MRILVVSPYPVFPPQTGSAVRTSQICSYLTGEKHDVFLLAPRGRNGRNFLPSDKIRVYTFRHRWGCQHFFNIGLLKTMKNIIKNHHIDLIFLSFPYQGLMVERISRKFSIPFVLDEHNIEFLRFRRMNRVFLSKVLRLIELYTVKKASKLFTVSEKEQQIIQDFFHRNCELMPNGVDNERFLPERNSSQLRAQLELGDKFIVLFFGALDYKPNREAVRLINNYIAPNVIKESPDTVFLIAGREPPPLAYHSSVHLLGVVKEIKDYIHMSDLVICPLLSGGGTRIKILEAFACRKIVLSTLIGAEGLNVKNNYNILLADVNDFPHEILKVKRGIYNKQIPHNAQKLALQYDWKLTLQPLKGINLKEGI